MIVLVSAIIMIVGVALVISYLNYLSIGPSNDLDPYPGDTENLNIAVIGENIEIRVVRTHIGTMDPHLGPTTIGCSLTINVTNTGQEAIGDFTPIMGTLFTPSHDVIYSFYTSFYGQGIPIMIGAIPANSSVDLYCGGIGSHALTPEQYGSLPDYAYIRMQFNCGDEELIITSPLSMILHAVE